MTIHPDRLYRLLQALDEAKGHTRISDRDGLTDYQGCSILHAHPIHLGSVWAVIVDKYLPPVAIDRAVFGRDLSAGQLNDAGTCPG
jgi:hypothetical protein